MIQPLQGQLQKGCWLDLGYLGSNKKELKYTKKPSSFLWLVIHVSGLCDSTKLRCWVLNLAEWYFTSLFTPRSINCLRIAVVYPGPQVSLYIPCPKISPNQKSPTRKKKSVCVPIISQENSQEIPQKIRVALHFSGSTSCRRPKILNWNCGPSERTILGAAFPLRCTTNFGGVDCVF